MLTSTVLDRATVKISTSLVFRLTYTLLPPQLSMYQCLRSLGAYSQLAGGLGNLLPLPESDGANRPASCLSLRHPVSATESHPEILGLPRLALSGNTCLHPSLNTRSIPLGLWITSPNGNHSNNLQTPLAKLCFDPKSSRSTATKLDSLAAELETDPQLSAAKRLQRTQALNSALSHAGLERQLLEAQRTTSDLKTKQRDKGPLIERLERDRRYLADREKEEHEEKERNQAKYEADTDICVLQALKTQIAATIHHPQYPYPSPRPSQTSTSSMPTSSKNTGQPLLPFDNA
ncbi:hypothetical protein BKA70DRAFT_1532602 [Coprinopsis sp. MPI-PUGE-AT-0042]|nr:hypothetical protein BKA70DRAFT_1532602 [Coprinopsis sp. MPI-PUGE-AT-0042]